MSIYAIEKNIPVPPVTTYVRGRKSIYPFKAMKVGDSFYVNGGATGKSLSSAAASHSHRNGDKQKFSVRKEKDGVRCWRVK